MRLPLLRLPALRTLLPPWPKAAAAGSTSGRPFPMLSIDPLATRPGHVTPAAPRPPKGKPDDESQAVDDAMDPLARQAAQLGPPVVVAAFAPPPAAPSVSPVAAPAPSLEELLPQLVRKLALAGDGKRATVRVEIGAGALAGATVVVSNESGGIRVDVEAPTLASGADRDAWSARIRDRLEARGLRVEAIRIT